MSEIVWQKTACILCSINCGLEVRVEDRRLIKLRGDRAHVSSQGYTCEKALELDHYQNARGRLSSPLRRRADGTFEALDWDTAISEIAARLGAIRDAHGGETIFYYGGGGQGNHLGGAYGRATRAALGSVYTSNALAQEKTGEFWVDGQLYGRPRCHTTPDVEHAEVAVFVGKNPWHSHGFPRARAVLKDIAKDPDRALIVIDPRRTETAELANYHLQLKPGTDVYCLGALLGVLVQEDLVNHTFLAEHAAPWEALREPLQRVPVADWSARAGLAEGDVRAVARRLARAKSASVLEDLGIQQAPNSTLNSYLEKLLYLLTGNFAKRGGMNIHTRFASLGGGGGGPGAVGRTTPVAGHRIIAGLVPCNGIPDEILADHPKRTRAMIVESANPAHSLADSPRMAEALSALDCLVVLDVAMTETARFAHYVLPVATQFEKWECTFFNLEFPHNQFHLRAPVLPALPGTLPEAEIHTRLVRALGALPDDVLGPLADVAREDRSAFAGAFMQAVGMNPSLMALAPVVLYETLGKALPEGAQAAAVLWGLAQTTAMTYGDSVRRAGFDGDGPELGDKLFDAALASRSGLTFTVDDYEETWRRVETRDGRVNLAVPELLATFEQVLDTQPEPADAADAYPFILAAGERRASTANTLYRNPRWHKRGDNGALRMNPEDAVRIGVASGGRVVVTTKRGRAIAEVEVSETLRPGHITLPNGRGLLFEDGAGNDVVHGVPPNALTSSEDRDPIAGTPWHKHVRARVELAD